MSSLTVKCSKCSGLPPDLWICLHVCDVPGVFVAVCALTVLPAIAYACMFVFVRGLCVPGWVVCAWLCCVRVAVLCACGQCHSLNCGRQTKQHSVKVGARAHCSPIDATSPMRGLTTVALRSTTNGMPATPWP